MQGYGPTPSKLVLFELVISSVDKGNDLLTEVAQLILSSRAVITVFHKLTPLHDKGKQSTL